MNIDKLDIHKINKKEIRHQINNDILKEISKVKVGDFCIINRCLCRINKVGKLKLYFDEYDSYPELKSDYWIYKNIPYNTTKTYFKWCVPIVKIPNTNDLFKYKFIVKDGEFLGFDKNQPL